ncbi:MAG: hypothetical protein IT174_02775 [Acidobacteria bacterium]|nr:hypothetical protein [Acidobacteriota bacterium]
MNTEHFEQLKGSVVETGRILREEKPPSREFRFEVVDNPQPSEERWAICIDSDDHQLLIPRKLYLVRFGETGVWVRDENGETTSCDVDDFLPVAFAPEVQQLLAEAA